ncbi:hypothetical protein CsSME_00005699 [Camellia sinensis var. sinensis]
MQQPILVGQIVQRVYDDASVYAPKNNRIHYSGPLLPSSGNIKEMLKEHKRKIQLAVHKANLDNVKTKKMYGDNGQTHSLLHYR